MHASLAVALAYDRYLNSSHSHQRTLEESQHFFRSLTLFSQRLNDPITPEDKDAIWGTAAALAVIAFASPDTSTAGDYWPLKPSEPSDLEWLRMSEGKMSLWNAVNPLRPDSLFQVMAGTYSQMNSPLPKKGVNGVYKSLASICQLNNSSTAETNAYFNAVHTLSEIQHLPNECITVGHTERFSRSIQGAFKTLLQHKDPIALLLLYLWYQKCRKCIWWIELRARVECPAICLYLSLFHAKDRAIQAFLSAENTANRKL